MSYPPEIILRRLGNELKECREYIGSDFKLDPNATLPITIDMIMSNVFGYEAENKPITRHEFSIVITENYGQLKPEVRWRSHIFHPNIMDPDDGGLVCLKMLNEWEYGMHLSEFISNVEMLVMNPKPYNPFNTDSCMRAAKYYIDNETKFKATIRKG